MQTITVSRNDEIYEAFADVAQAADGTLICTYRESMGTQFAPLFSRNCAPQLRPGADLGPRAKWWWSALRRKPPKGWDGLNCSRIAACPRRGLCCSSLTYCSRIPLKNT